MAKPKMQSKGSAKSKIAASTRRQAASKAGKANEHKGRPPAKRAAPAKAKSPSKAAGKAAVSKSPSKAAGKAAGKAASKAAGKAAGKAASKAAGKAASKAAGKAASKAAAKSPSKAKAAAKPKRLAAKGQPVAKAKPAPRASAKPSAKLPSKHPGKAAGKASADAASEQRTLPAVELAPPPRRAKLARPAGDKASADKGAPGKRGGKTAASSGKRPAGEQAKASGAGSKPAQRKPPPAQQLELPVLGSPADNVRTSDEPRPLGAAATGLAPFRLIETSPGNHSLLLTEFGPSAEVFARYGVEAGGYAWESVARHLMEAVATHLRGRFGLDPESSMFCAYGKDEAALTELGGMLAALLHAPDELSSLIERMGPDALLD